MWCEAYVGPPEEGKGREMVGGAYMCIWLKETNGRYGGGVRNRDDWLEEREEKSEGGTIERRSNAERETW